MFGVQIRVFKVKESIYVGFKLIVYVSHLGFLTLHQFETHINGFLEPESPNFDPNHGFLSSIDTEIITFLPKEAAM